MPCCILLKYKMVKDITTCWLTLQLWGTASFPYFYAFVCGWLLGASQTQVLIGRAEQMQHSFHATLMSFALWSQNNRGLMTPVSGFFFFGVLNQHVLLSWVYLARYESTCWVSLAFDRGRRSTQNFVCRAWWVLCLLVFVL